MNTKFTVFEKTTGRVLFWGTASEPSVFENDLQGVLIGSSHEIGWLDAGVHHELPDQPSENHVFSYTAKQWEDPRTHETEWPLVRRKRDGLLMASDWTQLPDVPLATKEAWATYRQALRDITEQADPFNIVWPVEP